MPFTKPKVDLNSSKDQEVTKPQAEVLMKKFGPGGTGPDIGQMMAKQIGEEYRRRFATGKGKAR